MTTFFFPFLNCTFFCTVMVSTPFSHFAITVFMSANSGITNE